MEGSMATRILYHRAPEVPVLPPFFLSLCKESGVAVYGFSGQWFVHQHTVMRHLMTGIRSEKCIVRQFHLCANII